MESFITLSLMLPCEIIFLELFYCFGFSVFLFCCLSCKYVFMLFYWLNCSNFLFCMSLYIRMYFSLLSINFLFVFWSLLISLFKVGSKDFYWMPLNKGVCEFDKDVILLELRSFYNSFICLLTWRILKFISVFLSFQLLYLWISFESNLNEDCNPELF